MKPTIHENMFGTYIISSQGVTEMSHTGDIVRKTDEPCEMPAEVLTIYNEHIKYASTNKPPAG